MPHVVFGCVVILRHRFVCDTTRPHANLTIYTFWRCKYALLHLSEENVYISICQYIPQAFLQYENSVLDSKLKGYEIVVRLLPQPHDKGVMSQ